MPIRVREWMPQPGQILPQPLIEDDRGRFPLAIVKQVWDWLAAMRPRFDLHKPTDMILCLDRGAEKIVFVGAPQEGMGGGFEFTAKTAELLLRDKFTRLILAKYRCLVARHSSGLEILGPELGTIQEQRIQ